MHVALLALPALTLARALPEPGLQARGMWFLCDGANVPTYADCDALFSWLAALGDAHIGEHYW